VSREYQCGRCQGRFTVPTTRGRLPTACDPCKEALGMRVGQTVSSTLPPAARKPSILRDPFNSTPTTAPVPPPVLVPAPPPGQPPADFNESGAPVGPGPLELQLTAELDAMVMINPTAKTQSLLAVTLARAADRLDPGDVKTMLTIGKELRAILDGLNKAPRAGGDDDDDDRPFGAVRPEIQHPTAV
jgi:hypothetical protein